MMVDSVYFPICQSSPYNTLLRGKNQANNNACIFDIFASPIDSEIYIILNDQAERDVNTNTQNVFLT